MNGEWGPHTRSTHINCLELLAVHLSLKHFLPWLRGHHVLVRLDNSTVVAYINRQRGLGSPQVTHTGTQTDSLEKCPPAVTESSSRAGGLELWSRYSLQGQPTVWGLEASPRGGEADLAAIRSGGRGRLCIQGECSVSPVLLAARSESSTRGGCSSSRVAENPPLCFSQWPSFLQLWPE